MLGYDSSVVSSIKIAGLAIVDEALIELIDAGADEIVGVTYDASNKPDLRNQARHKAVDAARSKAEVYVDAAGVSLGPVVHIEDVDPATLFKGSNRGKASGASASGDLAPGQVTISAAVILGFTLAP